MNVEDFLTMAQATEAIGATGRRAIYRVIERAEAAGEGPVTVEVFGKRVVPKEKIEVLRRFYYPYYSEAHQAMVKVWGAKGGAASGVTKRARKKQARP